MLLRRHGAGPPPLREGQGPLGGRRHRRRRRRSRAEIAEEAVRLIEVEYEPLPAGHRHRGRHGRRRAARARGLGGLRGGRQPRAATATPLGYSTIVKGDAAAAMASADVVVKGRYVADASQGAPIEPRALIAQWQRRPRDGLELDAGAVRGALGRRPHAADPRVARAHRRPAARRRLRLQVRLPLRGPRRRAGPGRAPAGEDRLLAPRGVHRAGPPPRGHGHRARDGRAARTARSSRAAASSCSTRAPTAARAASSPRWPRCTRAARTRSQNVDVHSYLNYTNNQPSSSIRAPTAPQACWALEQHMDEVAAAIDMDPVELRRRTLIAEGDEGPAGQVFEPIGMKETLEKAVELIGYGQDLPEDEAIGVACGWWPSFGVPSGAYVKLNGDGSGTIITGAQESGTGAVMGLPLLAAEVLGMSPEDFSILYQDTDAGPWDMGSSGSQTTFNNGRAVIAGRRRGPRAAARRGGEGARGVARRPRARRRRRPRRWARRTSRSPSRDLAGSGTPFLGKGSGDVPEAPEVDASACVGRLGMESFLAPQLITQAAHVKVDRETGVVRVLRFAACPRLRRHRQQDRRRRPGLRRRGDGHRPGAQRGHAVRRERPPAQPAPARLQADDRRRRARDHDPLGRGARRRTPGPKGSKGVGEPPSVPTSGAVGNAIAKVVGRHVKHLPMTPERVWSAVPGERAMSGQYVAAATVEQAVAGARRPARAPVAGGTDLVVGARQGKAPLPERVVGIHGIDDLRGIEGPRRRAAARRPRHARASSSPTRSCASASRASPTRRPSSARTPRGPRARSAATS